MMEEEGGVCAMLTLKDSMRRPFRDGRRVGRGFTKAVMVLGPEGETVRVRCFTFLIEEHRDRNRRVLRCRVGVWFPGESAPVVGESLGDEYGYDRALEQLNGLLAVSGWTLLVVGNLPGSATGMDGRRVYRRCQGRQCLLIDPVPVEEWLAAGLR
jgi:hypothetical protein